jgi:hypothetical protein
MKESGSWASLLRGVSQQPPEVRQPGQHAEQVNLLPHPVSGLTRRRGSIYKNKLAVGNPSAPQELAMLAAAGGYRKLDHISQGKVYTVLIREANPDPLYGSAGYVAAPAVICYNTTDNVFVPLATDTATLARAQAIGRTGIGAAVSVGKYIVHSLIGEALTATNVDKWGIVGKNYPVIWVRGGAYDRRYTISIVGGATFFYDTPAATVAGSGTAISPQNIAANLAAAGVAAGVNIGRNGSHLYIVGVSTDVNCTDGGDGSLMRAVCKTTDSVDKLPLMGIHGQVVQIQTGLDNAFYVEAVGRDPTAFAEVIWRECAGVIQGGNCSLAMMTVEGGTLRLGFSSTLVSANPVPQFIPAAAGDTKNNPSPAFLRGFPITYLGLFQDRLMVGAGAAMAVSAAGDYFNFYRSTVTTVPLKDGFEMIAQGGEDDVLRHSVSYSKNLVVFGDRRQYSISGQIALTPTSANMSIMTNYADAANCVPVAAGGQIFYVRNTEGNVGLHEIKPGTFVDSAESFPASAQIGSYIKAPAGQIEVVSGSPSIVLIRSQAIPNGLAAFNYLDTQQSRQQDAWSRWEFDSLNGTLLGCKSTPNGVVLIWLRKVATGYTLIADLLPMSPELSTLPYLDSARPIGVVTAGTSEIADTAPAPWALAFDATSDRFLIGADLPNRASLSSEYPAQYSSAWVGLPFDSWVQPTNPYHRDSAGKAIVAGRLVVTSLAVNFKDSSGSIVTITDVNRSDTYTFNARVLGDILNTIGKVPVSSAIHTVPVGRETREYSMVIKSRKWFPFTMVSINWTGQSFNRTPRAQ